MQRNLILLSAALALCVAAAVGIWHAVKMEELVMVCVGLLPGLLPWWVLPETNGATVVVLVLVVGGLAGLGVLAWKTRWPVLTATFCLLVLAWPIAGPVRVAGVERVIKESFKPHPHSRDPSELLWRNWRVSPAEADLVVLCRRQLEADRVAYTVEEVWKGQRYLPPEFLPQPAGKVLFTEAHEPGTGYAKLRLVWYQRLPGSTNILTHGFAKYTAAVEWGRISAGWPGATTETVSLDQLRELIADSEPPGRD